MEAGGGLFPKGRPGDDECLVLKVRLLLVPVSEQIELLFRDLDWLYVEVNTPYFYSLAAGDEAMDSPSQLFGIFLTLPAPNEQR